MHFDVAALSKPSIWGEASRIVNEEGFRAFWKGNLVTIAHRLPYSAVNFYAYERFKNVTSDAFYIICMWSRSCCMCFEILNQFDNLFNVLQLLHLLLGENHRGNTSADLFVHFVGGGLSGVTAATATYPLDLVRTRLAAQVITNFHELKFWSSIVFISGLVNWHLLFH